MTKHVSTKRALLASVLSLLLCFSMLVGSTFAWFTDTATTSVNSIQAGTLDVGLQMATAWDENGTPTKWEDAEGKTLQFKKAAGAPATEEVLWEPGCTYQLPELRVVNYGNLNLSYTVAITGIGGDAMLNEVITWTYTFGSTGVSAASFFGNLTPGSKTAPTASDAILIKGHMEESAGNQYQGKTISGIGVTVSATQVPAEFDSFNNTYDTAAVNPYKTAFNNGGNILLTAPVVITSESAEAASVISTDSTVEFGDNIITLNLPNATRETENWKGIDVQAGNVVFNANNGGVVANGNFELYAVVVGTKESSANLTINGGNYVGGTTAVQVTKGTLTVNGGKFKTDDPKWTLNVMDANYKNGTASIVVKGGSFYKFDPSNNAAEGQGTSFVAEGYEVVKDGDWYHVVKQSAKVATAEQLKTILTQFTDSGAGDSVVFIENDIILEEGETWTPIEVKGYTGAGVVTVKGNGKTIKGLNAPLFAGGFAGTSGIIIEDLTIADSDITGDELGTGAFIECVDSMETIVLKNCHLKDSKVSGDRVGGLLGWVAGWSGEGAVTTDVSIQDCSVVDCVLTANGTLGGISGQTAGNPNTNVTIKNCTVTGNTLTSYDDSYRVGKVVGTSNVGHVSISGITESGNTLKQINGSAELLPAEGQTDLVGRYLPGETGSLTIDGISVKEAFESETVKP